MSFSEKWQDGRLVWFASYRCPQCGDALEEDGIGRLPENLREAVLAPDGVWAVALPAGALRATAVINAVRQVLGMSLQEVSELRSTNPEQIGTGTKAEAERIAAAVRGTGACPEVIKVMA